MEWHVRGNSHPKVRIPKMVSCDYSQCTVSQFFNNIARVPTAQQHSALSSSGVAESTRVSVCAESVHQSEQCPPAKLVDCGIVSIAPTNLISYVLSASMLFETIACYCLVCAGKKINVKHYASMPNIAHFFFVCCEIVL